MKVAVVQFDIQWETPAANRAVLEEIICEISHDTKLVALPEMFNSGFSNNFYEPVNHLTFKWMAQISEQYRIGLLGSIATVDKGKKYNRLFFFEKGKLLGHYDKQKLFSFGGENESFAPGRESKIFKFNNIDICPLICYDLRFPELSRRSHEILICVASWPDTRISHWRTLLQARAIENQSFVIAVNRIGEEPNGLVYNGQSMVVQPDGKIILETDSQEGLFEIELNFDLLKNYREQFPFLNDV